jgi:predicted dienelactone hydrolase
MKLMSWVVGLLFLMTAPVLAAGFTKVVVPDPGGPPLDAGIWYPSDASVAKQSLGPYTQSVAMDGPITGRALPLIVLSHGTGGSFGQHYDTAIALADAGFVVVAVTHTGDNVRDHSADLFTTAGYENRPRHIKAAVDYMLAAWPQHDRLDPARIGIFGFSAGGLTALVAIGGVPDLSLAQAHCAAHPDEYGCQKARQTAPLATRPLQLVHDPRIGAAVVAAPLGSVFTSSGLADITVPIQLWRGELDQVLPHPQHAQNVYDGLPTKPEYHVVPNAGHFVFMPPCTPVIESAAPEACRDPPGFDRAAFHREFNAAVVAFFKDKLRA